MTSPLVPTATITLDKERTLRMDLNAFSDFETMSGKSIMRGGLDMCPLDCEEVHEHKTLTINEIRALLWACLVQEDESLTTRDVGRMLHGGNMAYVTSILVTMIPNAMPEPEEGSSPDPLDPKAKRPAASNGGPDTAPRRPKTSA